MGHLPREFRNEVMRRMVGIAVVSEPAMRLIESTLQEDLLVNVARNNRNAHNGRMADIINKMEREQMEDVLQSLAEARPKAAETLRGLLFTFDDIIKLPAKSRLALFDQIPTERVVLALKGTDTDVPRFDSVDTFGPRTPRRRDRTFQWRPGAASRGRQGAAYDRRSRARNGRARRT